MPYKIRKQKCKQSDGDSGNYVVQKKKSGRWKKDSCHTSEKKAKGAVRARHANESDEIVRNFIREVLIFESTAPDRQIASGIYQGIMSSNFWEMPHKESDVDLVDDATFSTPAIETLMDALNDTAVSLGTDLYFILSVTDDERYTLAPEDQYDGYPNNWLMRGQYRGPEKGKHIVWVEFRPISDDYRMSDLVPEELVKILSRTINHELVHYNQLKKQAEAKGISEEAAWEELQDDPRQLSKSGTQADYLSLHNEIDAFAYEAAEELLDKYTPDEAMGVIRNKNPELSGIVGRYRRTLGSDRQSLEKFLAKVYTNIEKIADEDPQSFKDTALLEKKKSKKKKKKKPVRGYHPDDSYEPATEKNLHLDKATSHGGWPGGEYDPPVNVQISNWLKSMKMME